MNKSNKKGFTLAELLIVVAIIAVLVAIAIPVFTSQLEKAREATDAANIRAAYAELMADEISDTVKTGADAYKVTLTQKTAGWQNEDFKNSLEKTMTLKDAPVEGKTATLSYDGTKTGKAAVTCTFEQ